MATSIQGYSQLQANQYEQFDGLQSVKRHTRPRCTRRRCAPGYQSANALYNRPESFAPKNSSYFSQMAAIVEQFTNTLNSIIQGIFSALQKASAPQADAADTTAAEGASPPIEQSPSQQPAEAGETAPQEGVETPVSTPENTLGRRLQAALDDAGKASVLTEDGYTISCQGERESWTITDPDGRETRIWGDPHVVESDGDTWDFQERSTFVFGNNKVTVETVPLENGTAHTGKITVYNGDERVTISNINENDPRIAVVADDGRVHDAQLDDGTVYTLEQEENGEDSWQSNG